jgi:hypothetical protein
MSEGIPLPSDERKMLLHLAKLENAGIYNPPFATLMANIGDLDIIRGRRVAKYLEERGFVKPLYSLGEGIKYIELTANGRLIAANRGKIFGAPIPKVSTVYHIQNQNSNMTMGDHSPVNDSSNKSNSFNSVYEIIEKTPGINKEEVKEIVKRIEEENAKKEPNFNIIKELVGTLKVIAPTVVAVITKILFGT